MFLHMKNQYCENDYTTKPNLQIQCDPYQITNGIFHRTKTKDFTIRESESEVTQSCSTLCNPMDCSLPGSSVHGIFQASTGVGCHFLLQGIFLIQGLNPALPHYRQRLYPLNHQRSPFTTHMETQKTPSGQSSLEKEEWSGRSHPS